MRLDIFNNVVEAQLKRCANVLVHKGVEYSADDSVDRLAHFKKAAVITDGTPKTALLGMLSKHLVSVSDMCTDGQPYPLERWDEKITDSINYLLILRAMVEEEAANEKH